MILFFFQGCFSRIYAFPGPIRLTSLKHLEVVVDADYSFDYQGSQCYSKLNRLANLIKAAPYLQRLVLKVYLLFYSAPIYLFIYLVSISSLNEKLLTKKTQMLKLAARQ